jgi:hypothetical protein
VVWRAAMLEREYRGHGGVAQWLDSLGRAVKSLTVTLESVEDADATVAVARGRAVGFDYGGGTRIDSPLICVAEFDGELITRLSLFSDGGEADAYVASRAAG